MSATTPAGPPAGAAPDELGGTPQVAPDEAAGTAAAAASTDDSTATPAGGETMDTPRPPVASADTERKLERRRRAAILSEETAYGRATGLALDIADHLVFNQGRPPVAQLREYEAAVDLWLELADKRRAAQAACQAHAAETAE